MRRTLHDSHLPQLAFVMRRIVLPALLLLGLWVLPESAWAVNWFGLVNTGELYRSTNAGANWSIHATLAVSDAVGLSAGANSSDLYVATRSGTIHRSVDGGANWSAVGAVAASDVASFALDPFGKLLALTETGTLYASTDGGVTFTALAGLTGSNWVSIARGYSNRMYALTKTGEVMESLDLGATWTPKSAITVSNAVQIRRLGLDVFVLCATGEIYKSADFGVTWSPVSTLSSVGMASLVDDGAQLIAAMETGEVATSANGASWSWVGAINQLKVMSLGTDVPQATGIAEEGVVPAFRVSAPYPNPRVGFGGVRLPVSLAGPDRVRVQLFDASGRLIAEREEAPLAAGAHTLSWEPRVGSGAYMVRFESASGRTAHAKWIVVR